MGQVVDTPQQGEGTGCTSRKLTSSQEDRFSVFVFWVNELFISPICLDTRKPAQQRLLPLKFSIKNFETTQRLNEFKMQITGNPMAKPLCCNIGFIGL